MTNSRKAEALEALSSGSQLLDCILHDSQTWMNNLGPGVDFRDARTYLLNRIYEELEANR